MAQAAIGTCCRELVQLHHAGARADTRAEELMDSEGNSAKLGGV
jgi:hypothetical protein